MTPPSIWVVVDVLLRRYCFLDGFNDAHTYTAEKILFISSLKRPLLRGEARPIIVVRALLLLGSCSTLPVFVVNTVLFTPTWNPIYTRTYQEQQTATIDPDVSLAAPGNAGIVSWASALSRQIPYDYIATSVDVYLRNRSTIACPQKPIELGIGATTWVADYFNAAQAT
ncbi:hypothetical protein DFH08DRAFT_404166 [Mycena albidolilacea]|uniref:Uncharacterized protein n=1 Tax=Mycena albidolilacea TaxID=1033008 RepID=A0AAD7EZR7_9AGAR|nr:hypothetical protein DFH08DRAFT_404166 [Mycena albidolilacea]